MTDKKFLLVLGFILIFLAGCSQSPMQTPVLSEKPDFLNELASDQMPIIPANRMLAGAWQMNFNPSSLDVSLSSVREPMGHMNVKAYIPAPSVNVISFDPLTGILEVDITFQNPSALNIFDMRLIVYSDNYGSRLKNPDDYTNLFDIPGGMQINPFRAFACGEWRRQFSAYTYQIARVQLYFPQGAPTLNFAVDVSYPGNCLEPYAIQNWTCGKLQPDTSSSCMASLTVYDWQYNANSVKFWCPPVTGQVMVPFSQLDLYNWNGSITNTMGAREGYYTGVVIAGSADSGSQMLYDLVQVQVESYVPKVVQILYTPNGASDVDVIGNYAYIAARESGLIIADISNPLSPFITSTYPLSGVALYIDVDRGFAYLREGFNRIRMVSVSDPYNPGDVAGIITFGDGIKNFTVSGSYLYLAAGNNGFVIYDIRDKSDPREVVSIPLPDGSWSVTLSGKAAYVGTENGFAIFDVRNPQTPELVKYYSDSCRVNHCALNGYTLYTAGHFCGFSIFDITNPESPVLKSRLGMSQVGSPMELYYRDNGIMMAGGIGFAQIDVTFSENPIIKHNIYAGLTDGLAVKDNYAYMADFNTGLQIVQLNQQ